MSRRKPWKMWAKPKLPFLCRPFPNTSLLQLFFYFICDFFYLPSLFFSYKIYVFLFFTFSSFNLQMVDIQVGRGGGYFPHVTRVDAKIPFSHFREKRDSLSDRKFSRYFHRTRGKNFVARLAFRDFANRNIRVSLAFCESHNTFLKIISYLKVTTPHPPCRRKIIKH